ncbi:MAG: hypothetical protein ACK53K_01245 [Burkholderiales bacterium]|jgi:hypothetical protein
MNNSAQALAWRRGQLLRRAAQQRLNLQLALSGRPEHSHGIKVEQLTRSWPSWVKPLFAVLAPVVLFFIFQHPRSFFETAHRLHPIWRAWMLLRGRFPA